MDVTNAIMLFISYSIVAIIFDRKHMKLTTHVLHHFNMFIKTTNCFSSSAAINFISYVIAKIRAYYSLKRGGTAWECFYLISI